MRKADVEFHGTTPMGGNPQPAVNVKVYKSTESIKLPINLGSVAFPLCDKCEERLRLTGDGWQHETQVDHEPEHSGRFSDIEWQYTEPEFTHAWISEHISEQDVYGEWEFAISGAWEMLQDEATRIFDHGVKVYSEGRSGGWAWVDGLIDFEDWNAVNLSKWARFCNYARACADDVPYQMVTSIYMNVFEPWFEERNARRTEMLALQSIVRGDA